LFLINFYSPILGDAKVQLFFNINKVFRQFEPKP
jgi:hypothetical protein